jgi:hypothetical protein
MDMRVFVHVAIALALSCLAGFAPRSAAQPVNLHEQERISRTLLPEPYRPGLGAMCLRGNDLLARATRRGVDTAGDDTWIDALVHLRKQADGEWRFVREVAAVEYSVYADVFSVEHLDCEGPLAAYSHPMGASYVVELTSAGWQATSPGLGYGSHADVYRGTAAFGGRWMSPTTVALVRKNAAGQWVDITYAVGNPGSRLNTPEIRGPNDFWVASKEIAATGDEYEPPELGGEVVSDLQIFDLINGSWRVKTIDRCCLTGAVINDRVALKLDEWTKPGDVGSYFVRDAAGAWTVQHSLLSDEQMRPGEASFLGQRVFAPLFSHGIHDIGIFRQEAAGQYRHEATLNPSNLPTQSIFASVAFSVDGNRVATTAGGDIYIFDIPSTLPVPRRLEKSFSGPSTADWSYSGITDWRIVSSGGSRVFRQLRTDAWARAVLTTFSGKDLSIQADVRIHELAASSSSAGFMLRYTNLQNFYYLLVHRDFLEVGKYVNGAFQRIATAPLSLVLSRTYRFRIEAIGSHLRAFVNGQPVVDVIDDSHTRGLAGLAMFRARTDYDNVIVTTSPQTVLLSDEFQNSGGFDRPWTSAPANAWSIVTNNPELLSAYRYRQSLLTGTPRAVNGGPTRDQIVSALVRPQAFNAGVAGAFVGLMARHVDDSNHYYVALFRDRAAIRKRVNGLHSTIKQVPFTVVPGVAYRVRLEAIASSLRLYINERLVAEGVDGTLPTGRYGLITFNAAADFDNFKAIRP